MALIKCPECKRKISDQCENCPQCGYPIKSTLQNINAIEATNEETACEKKPFYKKIWVWVIAGIVLVGLVLSVVFLLARDTKPRLDKDGNPVFVELTNEVYTNAKKYKGYHINIKGKVFQVMSDNGNVKGIQVWIDPDTCEQNLMIYYATDAEVKQGDYIVCSGYIDSVTEYKNAYNATLYAPLVYSTDLRKATYIEVMAPATATLTPENLVEEQYGYSISVDKVEFSERETRLYVTATNNGKALLRFGDAVIIQNQKQYNSKTNYDADYDEIPYEIVKGAASSGIIVFPAINAEGFKLTIDIHSDDYDEELDKFTFVISKDLSFVETPVDTAPTIPPTTEAVVTQPYTEETSITPSKEETTIDSKTKAVNRAVELYNSDYLASPSWVKRTLISCDLFSEDDAQYAIENCNVDWKKTALSWANEYSGDSYVYPDLIEGDLLSRGYTDDEIEYALNNCNINWNEIAVSFTWYISDVYTRSGFIESLQTTYGFTKEQATYGVENSTIDWFSMAENYTDKLIEDNQVYFTYCREHHKSYEGWYDRCPDCHWDYLEIGGFCSFTREECISNVVNAGFSHEEAEYAVSRWDECDSLFAGGSNYRNTFAYYSFERYLVGRDFSREDMTAVMKDWGFSDSEIAYAQSFFEDYHFLN